VLVWVAETLLAGVLPSLPVPPAQLVWAAPLALGALGAFWAVLPAWSGSSRLRALRVHAANGFYLQHLLLRPRS
jgi:hypothetical protein